MVDINKNLLYDRYSDGYREENTINDINGAEMLVAIESMLFSKLRDDLEEAKLRCEDDEDDAAIGEYMALEAVLKRCKKFTNDAISMRYDKHALQSALQRSNFGSSYLGRPQNAYYQAKPSQPYGP